MPKITHSRARKPEWLKTRLRATQELPLVRNAIREMNLHTVCHEARCPNRNLCFSQGHATFLILGDTCTRNCAFCAIRNGTPAPPDADEPRNVAQAAAQMKLKYAVITSVTRDDLDDGGATHFAHTVECLRETLPGAGVEVLTPDFQGNRRALQTVLDECPDVFNHNVETVPRLYSAVRPQADFARSIAVLEYAAHNSTSIAKSGFMLGLGETRDEVHRLMDNLRASGVEILTIGQYLQPSPNNLPVARYVPPNEFDEYAEFGEKRLGFRRVFAGPFVRSSFMAEDIYAQLK